MGLGGILFSLNGRIGRGGFWLGVLMSVLLSIVSMGLIFMLVPMDQMLVLDANGQPVLDALGNPQFDYGNPAMMPAFIIYGISGLLGLWWSIAYTVKRLHDRGKSGWWYLLMIVLSFILVGFIWWLVECGILEGNEGPNKYGPDPRAA
ncbi:MAG: DUF805 domain-containing protein [Hyphomicrobiaceae bacterium]